MYFGCDVFGRGTFGGGGWGCGAALAAARAAGCSAALFAPGWVLECHERARFEALQERWWRGVEEAWSGGGSESGGDSGGDSGGGCAARALECRLPLSTHFNCGFGRRLYRQGRAVEGGAPWLDLCATQLLPNPGGGAGGGGAGGGEGLDMRLTTAAAFEGGSCVAVARRPPQAADALAAATGAAAAATGTLFKLALPLPGAAGGGGAGGGLRVSCVARAPEGAGPCAAALLLHLAGVRGGDSGGGGGGGGSTVALLMTPGGGGGGTTAAAAAAAEQLRAALPQARAAVGEPAAPEAAGGGWQRWTWRVAPAALGGAAAITGLSVAAVGPLSAPPVAAEEELEAEAVVARALLLLGEGAGVRVVAVARRLGRGLCLEESVRLLHSNYPDPAPILPPKIAPPGSLTTNQINTRHPTNRPPAHRLGIEVGTALEACKHQPVICKRPERSRSGGGCLLLWLRGRPSLGRHPF